MKFDLRVACKSCPFRKDAPGMNPVRLRVGRVIEIHNTVTNWHGGTFSCHKTVDYSRYDDDDFEGTYRPAAGEHHCAGAIGYVHNQGGDGVQFTKFAVYTNDRTYADYGPADEVFSSLQEWKESCDDYEEGEGDINTCETVGPNCLAPAGFMTGGGIAHGTESADGECRMCGAYTCSECIKGDDLCENCSDEEDDYE